MSTAEFDPNATSMGEEVAPEVYEELFAMRRSIDNFDAALVHILAERFRATQRVGVLKAKHNLPAGDAGREEAQIGRLRAMAKESSLDPEFAEKFLNFIISEVIRHHERIAIELNHPHGYCCPGSTVPPKPHKKTPGTLPTAANTPSYRPAAWGLSQQRIWWMPCTGYVVNWEIPTCRSCPSCRIAAGAPPLWHELSQHSTGSTRKGHPTGGD